MAHNIEVKGLNTGTMFTFALINDRVYLKLNRGYMSLKTCCWFSDDDQRGDIEIITSDGKRLFRRLSGPKLYRPSET